MTPIDQSYELLREDELRKLFPNISKSAIAANKVGGPRTGPRTIVQEQQVADTRKANHKSGPAKVDAQMHRQFSLTIVIQVSDNRRRDLDGALSTILDCLIVARRRFAPVDTRDTPNMPTGGQRKGRSGY